MNLIALAALLGTLLPLVISIIQHEKWPTQVRTLVALLAAVAASFAVVVGKGDWTGLNQATADAVGTALAGMILATWGSYHALWVKLGVAQWIEKATTWSRAHKSAVDELVDSVKALTPEQQAQVKQLLG